VTVTAAAIGVMLAAAAAAVLYVWYASRARRLASERLGEMVGTPAEEENREEQLIRTVKVFPPRYRYLPPSLGFVAVAVLWLVARLPIEVALAAGVLLGVLSYLVEDHVADQRAGVIEMQLAEAIDLLVGSLRAGASLLAAFESALQEARLPLRPYFQEVAGRIRLGDDPRVAVSELPVHVPLETFRLFATSLAIHWEVGGSLATTLGTVGRTVRDRVELSRRVRAQGIEAHASVAVVLLLAYGLGVLMWRANPDRLEAFVRSDVGTELVAGVIALQSIGLVWMSRLSRSSY
jgi:tight adherence protein B